MTVRRKAPPLKPNIESLARAPQNQLSYNGRLVVALATLVLTLAVFLMQIRHDFRQIALWRWMLSLLSTSLVSGLGLHIALRRGKRSLGLPFVWLFTALIVVPVMFAAISLLAPLPDNGTPQVQTLAQALKQAYGCMIVETLTAFLCLTAFAWALRHSMATGAKWRGAVLGTALGVWSGLGLELHCPYTATMHMILGHLLPILFLAALGAWITNRVAKI